MKNHIALLTAQYDAIQRKIDLMSAKRDYLNSKANHASGEAGRLSHRYAKALWPFDPHIMLTLPAETSHTAGILRSLKMDAQKNTFDMWLSGENGGYVNHDEVTVETLLKLNAGLVKETAPQAELDAFREAWLAAQERSNLYSDQVEKIRESIDDLKKERDAIGEDLASWICPFRPNDIINYDADGGQAWVGSIEYSPGSFTGFSVSLFKATAKGKGSRQLYTNDNHMLLHLNPEIVKAHAVAMQKTWELKNSSELPIAA